MTELERYKKAYATLVGQVDTVISRLKDSEIMLGPEATALRSAADALIKALLEAEAAIVTGEE